MARRVRRTSVGALGFPWDDMMVIPLLVVIAAQCPINTTPTVAIIFRRCRSRYGTGRPMRRACADGAASPCGSRTQRWNAGRPLGPAGRLGRRTRPFTPS